MSNKQLFTCQKCGAHTYLVDEQRTLVITHTHSLLCECGRSPTGFAAEGADEVRTTYSRFGELDEDHRWEYTDSEEMDSDTEAGEWEVLCPNCYDDAAAEDWTTVEADREVDEDSVEFHVTCASCRREIEFGWSHPDRAGRIWPVEASDFNPWKSWPEPRYRESWDARGWLRPLKR